MRRTLQAYIVVLICTLLSGCATHAVRFQDKKEAAIYPATYRDSAIIILSASNAEVLGEPIFGPIARPLLILGGILDLPFSLITDTICLPFDIAARKRQRTTDASNNAVEGVED